MKCPICNQSLTRRQVELPTNKNWESMRIDICEDGCGGIWFENFELEKVDNPGEVAGEQIIEYASFAPRDVERNEQHECPSCDDIVMRQHFYSIQREVEVDNCGGCGGMWLDGGELSEIRKLYDSEKQRKKDFDQFFASEFEEKLEERATEPGDNPVATLFRSISPSQWFS